MKELVKGFKIIIAVFAILGFALCVAFVLWTQYNKPCPTMNEDELRVFDDYVAFDGNLFCVNAEEYLGTAFLYMEAVSQSTVRQDYYKIEGLAVSDMVWSYNRLITIPNSYAKAFSILCGKQIANPLFTWEIESIEICNITANYSIGEDDISNPEGYQTIMDYSITDIEATRTGFTQIITDKEKIELFMSSIRNHYDSEDVFVDADLQQYLLKKNNYDLKVRVNFSNSSNVIWIAPMYIDERDGQIYLQVLKSIAGTRGLKTKEHWIPVNLSVNVEAFN